MATDDYWLDAGNPELYLRANLDLLDGTRPVALECWDSPRCPCRRIRVGDQQHRRRGRLGCWRRQCQRLGALAGRRRGRTGGSGKLSGHGQDRRGCLRHTERARPAWPGRAGRTAVGRIPTSCRRDVNILVVGGAGFLGSHLVDRLIAEGNTVDVVDDLSSGSLANLAEARSAGGSLKIHTLDVLADEFAALTALRSPDVVYHLAWLPPGRGTAAPGRPRRAERAVGARGGAHAGLEGGHCVARGCVVRRGAAARSADQGGPCLEPGRSARHRRQSRRRHAQHVSRRSHGRVHGAWR